VAGKEGEIEPLQRLTAGSCYHHAAPLCGERLFGIRSVVKKREADGYRIAPFGTATSRRLGEVAVRVATR
jgi:hypothetical protein